MEAIKVLRFIKEYGGQKVLDEVSFTVIEGGFCAVLGEKGAGKTLLLESLLGIRRLTSGNGYVFEHDCSGGNKELKNLVSYVPNDIIFDEKLTAGQFLKRTLKSHKIKDYTLILKYCHDFGINTKENLTDMTYKDNKCVAIINGIITHPKVMLLDEPYDLLDNDTYEKVMGVLTELNRTDGTTILCTAGKYVNVQGYAKKYIYLQKGKKLFEGGIEGGFKPSKVITLIEGDTKHLLELGAVTISEAPEKSFLLYEGDMGNLMEGISKTGCKDFCVEELTFEEQLLKSYDRWTKKSHL